ncbi:MAG TPA: hypothetical protein VMW69_06260 [Spirochaetia bacterium]|nr:hypothetical protein [Spirochaetia bacterium]
MTITARNNTIRASLGVSLLLFVGFLGALLDIYLVHPSGVGLLQFIRGEYAQIRGTSIFSLLFLLIYSFGGGLLLHSFFRKTVSSEMFFFVFFVLSLSIEAARGAQLVIIAQNAPSYYEIVVTRAVYFGRFFGVFCLFTAGLFATGINYQRFEIVLGITLLLAFTLSFSIPVSSESPLDTLVNRLGSRSQLLAVFFALEAFSVLNFALAAFLKRNVDYIWMALGLLLVMAGKDLLFFLVSPAPDAVGALLLVGGTVLFGHRTHIVYLWS